jgi:hypothetical protein
MTKRLLFPALLSLSLIGLTATQGMPQSEDEEDPGPVPKIVPSTTHIPRVGQTRQFRVAGAPKDAEVVSWDIAEASSPEVGVLANDQPGLLEFKGPDPGYVVLVARIKIDETTTQELTTDKIWLGSGRTKVEAKHSWKVFSDDDPQVVISFPPQASKRAMQVLMEKRGPRDLPEKARGRGPAAVFEFTALDAETGEDIGSEGFDQQVELTLHYEDADIPAGVAEEDLGVATFDEENGEWQAVPPEDVVAFDLGANTMTVRTPHASLWAVMEVSSLPTSVAKTTWGAVKSR